MKYKIGNLVDALIQGEVDVIAHGCNCFCEMKNGIAKQIIKKFPEVSQVDLETIKGQRKKLGTYSDFNTFHQGDSIRIVNLYSQYYHARNVPKGERIIDYDALDKALESFAMSLNHSDVIGLPKIGTGLAKGDWNKVKVLINKHLHKYNVTIYTLK